jgi:O-antigen/teichoic acid export membrane protein
VNRSVKTIKDTTKLLSAQLVGTLFSLFYFIVITRLFTEIELSALAIFGVLIGMNAMVTGLGLVGTCLQKAPEFLARGEKNKACALIRTSVIIPFLLSVFVAGAIFLTSRYISQLFFKTGEFSHLIRIMSLGIIIAKLHETLSHMLRVTDKFGKLSIVQVFNSIPVRLLALLLYFPFGINGYIWALVLGRAMAVIFSIYCLRELIFYGSGLYPLGKLISYSLPFWGDAFVRFGSMQADLFIIGVFLMPEQLATYYVVRRFFDYMVLYVGSLLEPITPKISEIKAESMVVVKRVFTKTSRYLSFSLIPVCFLIASISYPLLEIYGSKKYIAATPLVPILMMTAIVYGIYSMFGMNVYILGRPIEKFKQEGVAGILNVALGVAMIIPLNILGLALSRLISQSTAALFSKELLKKLTDVKFDAQAFKQAVIASMAMALLIVGLQLIYYRLFIIPLYILIGVGFFILLLCQKLNLEDISLLRNFLPAKLLPLANVIFLLSARLNHDLQSREKIS